MGYYRLLLSFMVLASHMMPPIFGYNVGIVAVCSFFILSGYVMTALIEKYYMNLQNITNFYIDRFIRLSPQFYFYTSLTSIFLLVFGLHHSWMNVEPSFQAGLAQFLIFPLNFYRQLPSMFIPQAWSLGLEAMFYLIFPFIIITRTRLVTAIASFAVFIFAISGRIDTDLYAYRYLPGTLFVFICGSWLYQTDAKWEKVLPVAVSIVMLGLLCLTYTLETRPDTIEERAILLGIGLGIPIVARLRGTFAHHGGDALAGNLSYGVFLNHNFIVGFLSSFTPWSPTGWGALEPFSIAGVCFLACAFSYMTFTVLEAPFIARRHSMRRTQLLATEPSFEAEKLQIDPLSSRPHI